MSKRDSRSLGGVAAEFYAQRTQQPFQGRLRVSRGKGNIIEYSSKMEHRLYLELKSLVYKYMGIDKIIDNIVNNMITQLGQLEMGFITGDRRC